MMKESMDYEVWCKLRFEIVETLDDLAYWQGKIDSGLEVLADTYANANKFNFLLDTFMDLAKVGCSVETGIHPVALTNEDVYKWLRIDYKTQYEALYESCKQRFSE